MFSAIKKIRLCQPARIYLSISIISLMLIAFQNFGDFSHYNIGSISCKVSNILYVFVFQFLYVMFWTYIINLICKDNNKSLAWLLVLLPYILSFVLVGAFIVS